MNIFIDQKDMYENSTNRFRTSDNLVIRIYTNWFNYWLTEDRVKFIAVGAPAGFATDLIAVQLAIQKEPPKD